MNRLGSIAIGTALLAASLSLAPAASASTPLKVVIDSCDTTTGTHPIGVCDFTISGGVGTITATYYSQNFGPLSIRWTQAPGNGSSSGTAQGSCGHGNSDFQIRVRDSTGATSSADKRFVCGV